MATIVHTASLHWKAVIRLRGFPTQCKTFRLKRDSRAWALQVEAKLHTAATSARTGMDMRLDAALARYEREVLPRKSESTQANDRRRLQILRQHLGQQLLSRLTSAQIARYREQRLTTPRRIFPKAHASYPATLSTGTVRQELVLLSHLYTIARREWGLASVANPVSDIALPSPALPRTRRITRREEKLLCRAFRDYANPQLGLIFRIAIETGMRASEIRGLKVCDVDLRRRTALISMTKNGTTRLIPLTITAAKALKDTITRRGRPAGCPWVFWGAVDRHGQCKPYCFQHAWWRTLVRLNLIGLRFHDLRHEAISRFVEMGMSDVEVAAISGHKTMQMLKRYVHLRTEHLLWRLDHPVRRK